MTGRIQPGHIKSMFKEWIIPHRNALAAMDKFDEMRAEKRRNRWDTEASGAFMLQKSQSSKSHTGNIAYFYQRVIPEARKDAWAQGLEDEQVKKLQKKVIYFKMPPKPNLGSFGTDLLDIVQSDEYPSNVWARISLARRLMLTAGIELLIIDSFDHLTKTNLDPRTRREASHVQDVLKTMIEYGIPIVFIGLPSARDTITTQFQLTHRIDEIPFDRIDWEKDRQEFQDYVGWTNEYMVQYGIFDDLADIDNDQVLKRLFFCCRRQYGILSNILREGAKIGSAAKSRKMELSHLSAAVDSYVVRKGIRNINPFEDMKKDFKLPVDLDDDSWDVEVTFN